MLVGPIGDNNIIYINFVHFLNLQLSFLWIIVNLHNKKFNSENIYCKNRNKVISSNAKFVYDFVEEFLSSGLCSSSHSAP